MTAQAQLNIQLLGGFAAELNGRPFTKIPSRKAEALLAYLVCHQRPFPRETLADLLWDDRPQDQALANLRSLLSGLRRVLKPYLTITRQEIGFNHDSSTWLDVTAFSGGMAILKREQPSQLLQNEAELAELEAAVALYRGDFLAGFHVRESRRFEEWASLERERWQRLAAQAWQVLARSMMQRGQYPSGLQYAVRLLEVDPLSEAAHRQMMLLLARSGQRSAALQQYQMCTRILDEELGVPPASETTTLYERIRSSQSAPLHNLPALDTPFVGRETELAELRRALAQPTSRLLTILGPGGIGKTRLALQAAHRIVVDQPGMFLHGIRFVPLHTLESMDGLLMRIAEALAFSFRGVEPPLAQLADFLREKEMLLILDTVEHLLAAAPTAVSRLTTLLQQAPSLTLLVTSRTRLNAAGERVFDMRGLPAPPPSSPVPVENYSAVQLFIQSAQRTLPDFQPTADDLTAVARICRLLDGMPLGIELAAAWVRLLSCAEIADGIAQDIDFLQQTGAADANRHGSLHAAFATSWRLLPPTEQRALSQLALFQGRFDREAAQAVAGAALPTLLRLADHSWIRRAPGDGRSTYEMLTVLRQFALEKLAADEALAADTRRRHQNYFVALLQQWLSDLQGGRQREGLDIIAEVIEDVQQAMTHAFAAGDLDALRRALPSLFHFYDTRSWFQTGAALFAQGMDAVAALPSSDAQAHVLAMLQARAGWFRFHLGQYETSRQLLQTSLETLRRLEETAERVFALNYLGAVTRHLGAYDEAEAYLREALMLAEAHGDRFGASIAYNILGQVASLRGEFEAAQALCRQGLALKRQLGDRWGMTYSLTYLGRVAQALGEHGEARALFAESQAISETLGDQRGVAFAQQNGAATAVALGEMETAAAGYQAALDISRDIGDRLGIALNLAHLGKVQTALGRQNEARLLLVDGLQTALAIGATPAMLEGILGTAVWHAQYGEVETAVRRLAYVRQHPGRSQNQETEAAQRLAQLDASLAALPTAPINDLVETIIREERTALHV